MSFTNSVKRTAFFRRERGIGKLTLLVFGTIVVALVFSANQILPFYYYFYELQNQMESVIRVAGTETDQEIRKKLMYHIKKMEIPADPEALKIERHGRKMIITLPYQEVFYLTYKGKTYDLYVFKFNAHAEGPF